MISEVKTNMMFIIYFLIPILIVMIYVYVQVNHTIIRSIEITTNKIIENKELKVLQISDIHNKRFSDGYTGLINRIKNVTPDIIVITGDMIDRGTGNFTEMYNLVEKLRSINNNLYFVSGNHEWGNQETHQFIEGLKKRSVRILNNDNIVFTMDDTSINLCGVDDIHTKHDNLNKALAGIDIQKYTILLSHSPSIVRKARNSIIDLILSGHTHGGQIRIPFIGAFISSGQGFFPRYSKGLYNLDDGKKLYIDSGLGTRLIPVRFLNQSQISLLKIIGQNPQKM